MMKYFKPALGVFICFMLSSSGFTQSMNAYEVKKQKIVDILQLHFPDRSVEEFNLDLFNKKELLQIEIQSYSVCMEHVASQVQKKAALKAKVDPIRAQIRTASDEEFRALIREHKELLNTSIPLMDLEDERGKHCQQLLDINEQAVLRKAAEQKH